MNKYDKISKEIYNIKNNPLHKSTFKSYQILTKYTGVPKLDKILDLVRTKIMPKFKPHLYESFNNSYNKWITLELNFYKEFNIINSSNPLKDLLLTTNGLNSLKELINRGVKAKLIHLNYLNYPFESI